MNKNNFELANLKQEPDLKGQFSYGGSEKIHIIDYEWFDVTTKENLPDIPWRRVHIVGNLNSEVPLVQYPQDACNLPGGGTENNETIEETVRREIQEELNCRVISWESLGYSTTYKDDEFDGNFLKIYAVLEKVGEFVSDSGGSVIGYKLTTIDQLADELKWQQTPDVAQRLQDLAKPYFKK